MIHRLLAAAPAFLLFAALLGSAGCTDEALARFEADQRKLKTGAAERQVKDRAEDYWTAVRWQNWSESAAFIEDPAERLAYLHDRTEGDPTFPTLDDIVIQYIFIDPESFSQAEIRAGWTEFLPPARMAAKKQVTQSWYKHDGQWWVTAEDATKTAAAVSPQGASK